MSCDDIAQECARFLGALFEGTEGLVEIRPLPEAPDAVKDAEARRESDSKDRDRKTSRLRRWLSVAEAADSAGDVVRWCEDAGYGAFFGVLPRRARGFGTKANVAPGRVVWADLDFKDYEDGEEEARERLALLRCDPSILVRSGHGYHAYWLLDELTLPELIEGTNVQIIEAIGADPSCKDLSRILRLPGSCNVKDPDRRFRSEVIDFNPERRYPLAVVVEATIRQMPPEAHQAATRATHSTPGQVTEIAGAGPSARYVEATIAGVVATVSTAPAGGRNRELNAGAYALGRLVGAGGLSENDARLHLSEAGTACGLSLGEVKRTIDSGLTAGRVCPWVDDGAPRRVSGGKRAKRSRKTPTDPTGEQGGEVREGLDLKRDGDPRSNPGNLSRILTTDSRWEGRVWLNEHDGRIYVDDRLLTDADEIAYRVWLSGAYEIEAGQQVTHDAFIHAAHLVRRHPLREWLKEAEEEGFDGQSRCEDLLHRYFGAEDSELHSAISKAFLVGCVRRAFEPGCKVDNVLILVGKQGALKSTAFRALAGQDRWFSDTGIDFRSKDAYQNLPGVWIYELAELDSMRRSDASAIKAFLSAQIDRYRPSYGRNVVEQPRQCVFVGTTNEAEFLADHTGSRRFWPVQVGAIDIDAIKRDLRSIWAETMAWYRMGVKHWIEGDLSDALADHSEQYRQRDPWEGTVRAWLDTRHAPFRAETVLIEALNQEDKHRMSRSDGMRIAAILKGSGCEKSRRRVDGTRAWWWTKPAVVIDFVGARARSEVEDSD